MNLVLLEPGEVDGEGRAVLRDERATHMRVVLGVAPGRSVRIGLRNGPLGEAAVEAVQDEAVVLRCRFGAAPPRPEDVLLLAVPRPKVLQRLLEHATAMGFGRIVLFRSWRVEKSHLQSQVMSPDGRAPHLGRGLQQGVRTHEPAVAFFPLFRPFVEDHLPELGLPEHRFVAHPGAAGAAGHRLPAAAPFALCLGPEGGFLPYEVAQLQARGFRPLGLGPHPLRTETALPALWGQLDLLRQQQREGQP